MTVAIAFSDRPNHKLEYPIGVNFCLEESVDGYYFTSNCSLQSPVDPVAKFQFNVTRNFSGGFNSLDNYTEDIDINVSVISETRQSVTVKMNGSFIFPETGIQVNCVVSNPNGYDIVSTTVRLCGKGHLIS